MGVQEDFSQGEYAGATARVVADLRDEYLVELGDRIATLDAEIAAAGAAPDALAPDALAKLTGQLRVFAFGLKGQSHNFGLLLLNSVARRLEDYLANIDCLEPPLLDQMRCFLDVLTDILDGRVAVNTPVAEVIRRLPAKPSFDAAEIMTRDLEIMLVMLHGAQTRYVQRELQECGYRVTIVTSTCDAIGQVLRTRPALVIVSAVMAELSGVDLILALRAMPETRNTPVALITSFGPGHASLAPLPDSVPVITKGPDMGDDLTDALQSLFLL